MIPSRYQRWGLCWFGQRESAFRNGRESIERPRYYAGYVLAPEVAVQAAVADRFGEVRFIDRLIASNVGDRSSDSQDLVVRSRR
ncbi:hypothetical protein Pla52o_32970 [Novipirellula galeiformis]|uniref:Uncharacterized protein n=1 Tax=Novipirellula galeiformis TaxID=2528004 RepID=A0A5C6CFT7_9BACT|nr:hypothetical protein Pla52o_32970 [Novipirellula galeiformis]